MTATPNFALTQAYQLLQQIVQDLLNAGRRRVGAFLKPELVKRTGGNFNERALGFAKFHDFLRAAEAAKFVTLTSTGPDLEAWLPTSNLPTPVKEVAQAEGSPEFTPRPRARISIRPDLWIAFVDFTPGFLRLYDKLADRAHKIPQALYPGESDQVVELRRRFQARDPNLLLLEPIAQTSVLDWMRTFAAQQTGPLAEQLRVALNSDHPMQTFTQVVRSRPDLYGQWHRQRIENVAEHIRSLFAPNGIRTQVTVPYDSEARTPAFPSGPRVRESLLCATASASARTGFLDSVSVVQQIDDLIKSLLRLRGTIGYLESSEKDG